MQSTPAGVSAVDTASSSRRPQLSHSGPIGQWRVSSRLAEGKSPKEALRCLKRRLSDAVYRCLVADQREQPHSLGATG